MPLMDRIRAVVRDGRLIVDLPTDLPEGTVLELAPIDEGDDLSDEERAILHRALERAWQQAREGQLRSAHDVLGELRRSG
jgi:hypothetical protein